MKNFMEPEMSITKFSVEDIITTSVSGGDSNANVGGGGNLYD